MTNMTILISGASIGGTTLAYWLDRHGFDVTVVERAPGLRPGGQALDVRGPALDVAERMGILADLREHGTDMRGMSMVDAEGTEVFRSTERTFTGGSLDSPDVEIMRDDLCRRLYRASADRVEYLFDDSITGIVQDEQGVEVTFEHRSPRSFDLVVGADGLHSNVRRLVFGPESEYLTYLGTYLAVFTTPNFLDLDRWQVFCQLGSVGGGIMSAGDNAEARVYAGFESVEPLDYDVRDVQAQRRILADRMAGAGWEFPRAIRYMWDAPDFHFDSMSQIHLDDWSRGRVVLLGDAGYCGSPLSGQGTSMAMVGAYVLAGELRAADGEHRKGFAAYQDELADYVAGNQRLALTNRARIEAETTGSVPETAPEGEPDSGGSGDEDFAEVVNVLTLKEYGDHPAGRS